MAVRVPQFQWRSKADMKPPTSPTSIAKAAVPLVVMAVATAVLAGAAREADAVVIGAVVAVARAAKSVYDTSNVGEQRCSPICAMGHS